MSAEQGYNGWKNYPTWAVNLWLSNDQATDVMTREVVSQAVDHHETSEYWTPEEALLFGVEDALESFVKDELAPDLGATFAADLLGWALEQVDFREIAAHYIEDLEPQEA